MKGTSCEFICMCPEVLQYLALGISDPCFVGRVCGISTGEREKKKQHDSVQKQRCGFCGSNIGQASSEGVMLGQNLVCEGVLEFSFMEILKLTCTRALSFPFVRLFV